MASTDESRTDRGAWRIAGLVALAFLVAAYGLIALFAPDRAHGVDAAIGAGGLAAMAGALSYLLRSRQERDKRVLAIQLAESRERLGAVLDNANLGIIVHVDGVVVLANPWAARLFGHPDVEAVLGRRAIDFVHPDSRPLALRRIAQATAAGFGEVLPPIEERFQRHDGTAYIAEVSAIRIHFDGKPGHLVLFRDLSDRKETERRQKLASTVFNVAANAIVITDSANNILTVNPAFTKITGYESEEVVGRNPRFLQSGRHEAAFYSELWGEITGKGSWEGEIWNRKKNGEIYPEWLSINAVRDESGAITHHVAIFADITDRKLSEERVQYLAHFDPLTDLPNRVLFRDRLDQAIARCARSRTRFALLFIDLDRFKTINDTLGHHVGDIYLREAASRMSHLLRRSDTVARLSGDEFIAIVNDVRHPAHAGQVAQKLIEQVGLPTSVQGHELIITPSIGISVYPEDGEAADDLLRHADAAMYEAKRLGRSRYVFFTGGLADRARERARRENALRKAVANGDFTLHYQPLLDLTTGDVIGIEALIRAKPETGLGGPAEFIPLAEEIGLIQQIDRWVLAAASRQARAWREAGRRLVPISVNISPAHLRDPGFVDDVVGTIVLSGARPEDIELELTETAIMDNIDQAAAAFADLRARGMRLAVDDFGTGYSSLTRLRRLPIHRIKIDRSFVRGLTDGGEDKAIVNAILQIAKGMRLRTVAEGVERQEEYNVLLDLGCDAVQGFLFQRPVPPEEVVTDFIAMPMRTGPG